MTLADFQVLMQQKLLVNCFVLVLSGGEPLLNPDFFKIVNYAGSFFPIIHLTTNGILLGKYLSEIIESPLTNINISFDAVDSDEYNRMRCGNIASGMFDIVKENMRRLVEINKRNKKKMRIIISSVVGRMNYRNMDNFIKMAIGLGVDAVNFQNICGFNCNELSKQTLMVEDKDVVNYINNLKLKYKKFSVVYPKIYSVDKKKRGCRQCFDAITVDADGNVGPCSVMVPKSDTEYGNLFSEKEVWNNNAYQKLRSSLLDDSKPLVSEYCRDCTFLNGDFF
jgi:pyrroloquinoline quinone biosynthesis protein E